MNAWEVGGYVTLTATKVLDLALTVLHDDDYRDQTVDRSFWRHQSSRAAMKVADGMLELIHKATGDSRLALKYNRHYIGLAREGALDNFVTVRPCLGSRARRNTESIWECWSHGEKRP